MIHKHKKWQQTACGVVRALDRLLVLPDAQNVVELTSATMQHRPHTRAQVAPRGGLCTRVLHVLQAHGVIREQGLAVLLVTVRFALRMLQFVDVGLHIQLKSLYFALVRPHGIGLVLPHLFLGAAWLSGLGLGLHIRGAMLRGFGGPVKKKRARSSKDQR